MSAAYSNLFMDQGSTFETSIVLDEMDRSIHDSSSNELFIKPEDGMIIITNAWMPHSCTRNLSNLYILISELNKLE